LDMRRDVRICVEQEMWVEANDGRSPADDSGTILGAGADRETLGFQHARNEEAA
jgi:hypothetical protein